MTLLAAPTAIRPTTTAAAEFIELDECFPQAPRAGVSVTVDLASRRSLHAHITEWAQALTGSVEACSDL